MGAPECPEDLYDYDDEEGEEDGGSEPDFEGMAADRLADLDHDANLDNDYR